METTMKPGKMLVATLAGAIAFANIGNAIAEVYPSRPITMVVPFPPGGTLDVIGRIVGERIQVALGQPVILDNVGGAAGSIGVGRAVRAAPDGYTLSIGTWGTHVVNGATQQLAYDVLKDFEPIALLSSNPELIVAKNEIGRAHV